MEATRSKTIEELVQGIDPGKEYSASQVAKSGWTFWRAVLSFTRFLNTDEGKRLYKPISFTQGAVKRYKVRGSDVIEVLRLREKGEITIDHVKTT